MISESERHPQADILDVVAEIRAEAGRRIASGEIPPESASSLDGLYGVANARQAMLARLRALGELDPGEPLPTGSERRVVGPVVSLSKRLIDRSLRWQTEALVARLEAVLHRVTDALIAANSRMDEIDRRLAGESSAIDELRDEIASLRETLDRLTRSDR